MAGACNDINPTLVLAGVTASLVANLGGSLALMTANATRPVEQDVIVNMAICPDPHVVDSPVAIAAWTADQQVSPFRQITAVEIGQELSGKPPAGYARRLRCDTRYWLIPDDPPPNRTEAR